MFRLAASRRSSILLLRTSAKRRNFAVSAAVKGESVVSVDSSSPSDDYEIRVIQTESEAKTFIQDILKFDIDARFACDTEADIDIKNESPVGNGTVTCISVYPSSITKNECAWIDILDGEPGVLDVVKPFFESKKAKKVWHNYSFDRHVLYNHGVNVQGLGGDTMHMARLVDSSLDKLSGAGGYSLESLSKYCGVNVEKTSMKELFGVPNILRNGNEGKILKLPSAAEIQRSANREKWLEYSCRDSKVTYDVYRILEKKLVDRRWRNGQNMFDMYQELLLPFGELLTDLERRGFLIDMDHLRNIELLAQKDAKEALFKFESWVKTCGAFKNEEDASMFNPSSSLQKQFLFFAKNGVLAPKRDSKKGKGKPVKGIGKTEGNEIKLAKFEVLNTMGFIEPGSQKPKKKRTVSLKGLGITPTSFTSTGWPSVNSSVLQTLAGKPDNDPPIWGKAKKAAGKEGCIAIHELNRAAAIDKLLSTFILPLQRRVDEDYRIHCSLNLNTETGRLSSRAPNLQNQPALEKDIYKIRKAFISPKGHKLIVADYGQLELRVLAHLAQCKSMIKAFEDGGDFHSRTAMGMYPYIAKATEEGTVMLEWDYANGDKPEHIPLIKDKYASERRKAKVLNFSIAYGKTAFGLSKDFGVSKEEAADTLEKWYGDRPEVRHWQNKTCKDLEKNKYVSTIWGRRRQLPNILSDDMKKRSASRRAAINTPIQGSAADIVMGAMLRVHQNEVLERMGWEMILQVHDEIILQGPEETAQEAMELVVKDMQNPVGIEPLLVELVVDADIADNWYDAK